MRVWRPVVEPRSNASWCGQAASPGEKNAPELMSSRKKKFLIFFNFKNKTNFVSTYDSTGLELVAIELLLGFVN